MLDFEGKIINISGVRYTVHMVDEIHRCGDSERCDVCGDRCEDTFGMIREKKMIIEIANDIDDQQKIATLLHEIVHGYLFRWTNYRKMDPEFVCEFFASMFSCILTDNPWVGALFTPEVSVVVPGVYSRMKAEQEMERFIKEQQAASAVEYGTTYTKPEIEK